MLRFVRIEHDDELEEHNWFSFYCTVMDEFVWFNDNQIFKSRDHFIESYNKKKSHEEGREISRYLALIPDTLTSPNSRYRKCEHLRVKEQTKANCFPYGDDITVKVCLDCGLTL